MARVRRNDIIGGSINSSSSSSNNIVFAVIGAIAVILFAAAAYMTANTVTGTVSTSTPLQWWPITRMPGQRWGSGLFDTSIDNGGGGIIPTTPPLQDHLDRIFPDPVTEIVHAPNRLARLRAESSWGATMFGGGGAAPWSSALSSMIPSPPIPVSVRPPIDRTYKQVGTIARRRGDGGDVDNADLDILPLMGQWLRDDKWRYFTVTGGGAGVRLPVERVADNNGGGSSGSSKRRGGGCTSEYGCGELFSDDVLAVSGFKDKFVANVYDNGTFYS